MIKIRLQRHGKKKNPFYHLIVADARSPRDGKFIEKIGSYYPMTNPSKITLDIDRSIFWIKQGAQPTNTARTILSSKGVFYKIHLHSGLLKKSFTKEELVKKFDTWIEQKK